MKNLTVAGKKYKVSEYVGFQHSSGTYNCFVETDEGEKNAYRFPGSKKWRFWTVNNRFGRP
jgi:hypothetical protein